MPTGNKSRQKYPLAQFNEPRPFIVAGSFETDGTNDPTAVRGRGFDVAYQATGEYVITFPDAYPQMISCVGTLEGEAEVDSYVEVDSYTPATKTLVLRVLTNAGAAVAEDGPRLNFIAVFQLSGTLAKTVNAS